MSLQSIYIQNTNENVNNKLSNYVLKDKNNEDILIIFKQNSVILNLNEPKKQNEEISMANFIENINFIKSSKNIVDISKNINLENISLISYAGIHSNKYKNALKGLNKEFMYIYMIKKINCEINPIVNNKLRQSIAIIKWKIYNFMIQRENLQINKNKYIEFDTLVSHYIALLCGIYLYFDEKDEINNTSLLNDILKPFTVNSFI